MSLRKQIKQNARRALNGSWGKAICIFMVALAIFVVFSLLQGLTSLLLGVPDFQDLSATPELYLDDSLNISFISLLISTIYSGFALLIDSPLSFGQRQWYYKLAGGDSDEVVSVFSFFSSIKLLGKTIWHDVSLTVRLFLWSIPFSVVPGAICFCASLMLGTSGSSSESMMRLGGIMLMLFGMLLAVLALVFFLIFITRYYLSAYLIVDKPEISVREAFALSRRYTKGNRTDLFVLTLSFAPWFALSALVFPLLYVVPYYNGTRALYAKYLIERGRLHDPQEQTVQFHLNAEDIAPPVQEQDNAATE